MSHNRAAAAASEVASEAAAENALSDDNDLLWGGENIAKEINRTTQQFYYLHEKGVLKGAVAKLGHNTKGHDG